MTALAYSVSGIVLRSGRSANFGEGKASTPTAVRDVTIKPESLCRLARLFYRTTGSDFVTPVRPMHRPYHLYEFSLRLFQLHAEANTYQIAHYVYYMCESYMPRPLKPLFNLLMRASRTGMQLADWLRK
jgi:hypothetical protein